MKASLHAHIEAHVCMVRAGRTCHDVGALSLSLYIYI